MEAIARHEPRARKAHQCDLCWTDIDPGKTYVRLVMADVGTVWTWKAHQRCDELAGLWIAAFDYDNRGVDGGSYDQIVEDLCEHHGCEIGEIKAQM